MAELVQERGARSWELGNRRYIREKVIALYEQVFDASACRGAYVSPDEDVWRELFVLKVNRLWLRQCVLAMPEEHIMGARKPLFREIFARCVAQLGAVDAEVRAHALETLSALLSALGAKSFPDPGSDTLELFCGIARVEAVMAQLLAALRAMLASDNAATVHGALTGALSIGCLTPNVNQNILLEFVVGGGLADGVLGVLYGPPLDASKPALREQALKLTMLLSSYHKYESRNPFHLRLSACACAADVALALAPSAELLASANLGPTDAELGASTAPVTNAGAVAGTLYSALQWGLEMLTLDDLVPGGAASGSVNATVDAAGRSELLAAALHAYEVVSGNPAMFGAAFFSLLPPAASARVNGSAHAAQGGAAARNGGSGPRAPSRVAAAAAADAAPAAAPSVAVSNGGGSMSSPSADRATAHCATLRHLITLVSLGSLELRKPAAAVMSRLCLLALLSAASSGKLLQAAHARGLGGDLPLWRIERGAAVLRRTTRHATLGSALLEVVALTLQQNLRRAVPAETFHCALLLLQRIMLWELGTTVRMAGGAWRRVQTAVLHSLLHCGSVADLPEGESHSGWLGLCLQHMSVVNLLLIHGGAFLPQATLQQQFAYEIVRLHREFERLFNEGKRRDASGRLLAALALVRRIIALTLKTLPAPSGPSHSHAEVMGALRELQFEAEPQMAAALHRWQLPPENPTHVPFFHAVSRQLVASYRGDATLEFAAAVGDGRR